MFLRVGDRLINSEQIITISVESYYMGFQKLGESVCIKLTNWAEDSDKGIVWVTKHGTREEAEKSLDAIQQKLLTTGVIVL